MYAYVLCGLLRVWRPASGSRVGVWKGGSAGAHAEQARGGLTTITLKPSRYTRGPAADFR